MENLNKFGDKLMEYLNSAEIFLKANVPDFVQQFVAYESWKAEIWFKISLGILIILIVFQIIIFIMISFDKYKKEEMVIPIVGVGIIGTVMLFSTIDAYFNVKKLEMAPKVFMIEKAKALLTKENK